MLLKHPPSPQPPQLRRHHIKAQRHILPFLKKAAHAQQCNLPNPPRHVLRRGELQIHHVHVCIAVYQLLGAGFLVTLVGGCVLIGCADGQLGCLQDGAKISTVLSECQRSVERRPTQQAVRDVDLSISRRCRGITHYDIIKILTIVRKPNRDRRARHAVKVRRGREVTARTPVQFLIHSQFSKR